MAYLTGLGVVAPPPETTPTANDLVVGDYRRHLVIDRGLATSTVDHYVDVAQKVLAQWGDQGLELAAVTAGEVTAFVVGESRRCNVPTAKALVTVLRSWLRFLAAQGLRAQDLVGAVPAVAGRRGGWVPRGLSDADVAALLAAST